MKKWTAILLLLAMLLLTACSGVPVIRPEQPATQPPETQATQPATEPQEGSSDTLKTGLALVPTVGSSRDFGEKNGLAQSDITLVAVLVDSNGVIVDCVIDSIQAKAEFDGEGKLLTDLSAPVPTKNELGDSYGMKQFSGIGKEWNEQAQALADYAVGKTVEELKGIALNERGAAADADLSSSVTVSIGGYVDAIALAVENARELGAVRGDSLKLTAVTTLKGNDAGEENGLVQADATVAAISFRNDVISSCVIDSVQCAVKFDTAGKITTDLTAAPLTKNQLGDEYGMKKFSSIGKEWYEQAQGFAAYVTGKTSAEVAGTALTETGAAADVDLASSVTINLGAFLELIRKTQPADSLRTGLALVPTVGSSRDFGEKNGLAQSDITLVAVLVDSNGVIVDCVIDSIQAKAEFDGEGKLLTDLSAPIPTKNELGDSYGMKQFSGIGKEWNEQAQALADYAVGKTVEELKGIALNERGAAADTDLSSSVTVSIGGYVDAIALAVENARELGAVRGDSLKLTAVTTLKGNDAGEENGLAQADATVAAISFRNDVISSCVIDSVQCAVKFDTAGKITTDLTAAPLTKNQLGDEYGMKKFSSIGKEWYEQAQGFAAYVTGKTSAEVAGTALTEAGTAADVDLASSVTINLGAFLELIRKAGN